MNKLLRLIVVAGLITIGSASALLQGTPGDDFSIAHNNLMNILLNIQQQASALNSPYARAIKTNIDQAIKQDTIANTECQLNGLQVVDAVHILLLQYLNLAHEAAGNITNSYLSKQIEAAKQAAWNANQACHAYINSLN